MKLGKYELVRRLATGGAAEVFLAKTEWLGGVEKTVVVKRVLPHLAEDQSFVDMFLTEAKLAAHLTHPNIAQIFDFGQAEGAYYLVMEHVDGPSLRALERHHRKDHIPFRICAKLVSYACEALAYAHDLVDPATGVPLELVHRDISPENILLAKSGAVKVVDFGIAKAVIQNHHTKTGLIKGKLEYMAPEQLRAQPLNRQADVYALGIVLYELIAGAKTHNAKSSVALIHHLLFEPPVPVRERRPDVPPDLESIINRAIAHERADRYPDCRAMIQELERFIMKSGDEPVGAFEISKLVTALPETPTAQAKTPPRKESATSVQRPPGTLRTPPSVQQEVGEASAWPSTEGGGHTEIAAESQRPLQGQDPQGPGSGPSDRTELLDIAVPAPREKKNASQVRQVAPAAPPAPAPTGTPPRRRSLLLLGAAGGALLLGVAGWFAFRPTPAPAMAERTPLAEPPPSQAPEVQPVRQDEPSREPSETRDPAPPETTAASPAQPKRPAVHPKVALGALACATRPNDAEIYVDGRLMGRTPVSKSNPIQLHPGKHSVTFKLNGKKVDREIEVKSGELYILSGVEL